MFQFFLRLGFWPYFVFPKGQKVMVAGSAKKSGSGSRGRFIFYLSKVSISLGFLS